MSKTLNKCIASSDYFDKSSIVLSVTTGSISIATVIGAPVEILKAGFSLAFSIFTEILKKLLKTRRNRKRKLKKIVMLAISKLNSIESKISEASVNSDFMTIINEEIKYRELNESITMMNSPRSKTEKINLIKKGKELGIDEVIKHNEIVNKSLKSQI